MGCGASSAAADKPEQTAPAATPEAAKPPPAAEPAPAPAKEETKKEEPKAEAPKAEPPKEEPKAEPPKEAAPEPPKEEAPKEAAPEAPKACAPVCSNKKFAIFGPPASGKGAMLAKITEELGVKSVMEFMITKKARETNDDEAAKADGNMCAALNALLNDSSFANGCCIDCFPKTGAQAKALEAAEVALDKVIIVEVDQQTIIDFHNRRVVDPETNTIYDTQTNPPPEDVKERCVQREPDTEEKVKEKLKPFYDEVEAIKAVYGDRVICVKGTPEQGEQADACVAELMAKLK